MIIFNIKIFQIDKRIFKNSKYTKIIAQSFRCIVDQVKRGEQSRRKFFEGLKKVRQEKKTEPWK